MFTLLPLVVSVYVVIWLLRVLENFARSTLLIFWPDFLYLPGLGVVVVCAVIFGFGMVVDQPLTMWLFRLLENALSQVPLLKSVYLALKDFTGFLQPKNDRKGSAVVSVQIPNIDAQFVGLVTREDLSHLAQGLNMKDKIAVYFPMSYQFGGYTVFIPRSWIRPVNMGVEEAMRHILTAWLPGGAQRLEISTETDSNS